jgi:hypothetical protein
MKKKIRRFVWIPGSDLALVFIFVLVGFFMDYSRIADDGRQIVI